MEARKRKSLPRREKVIPMIKLESRSLKRPPILSRTLKLMAKMGKGKQRQRMATTHSQISRKGRENNRVSSEELSTIHQLLCPCVFNTWYTRIYCKVPVGVCFNGRWSGYRRCRGGLVMLCATIYYLTFFASTVFFMKHHRCFDNGVHQ